METILLKRRAGENGPLTIPIPDALQDKELEVLIVLQPIVTSDQTERDASDEHGWPIGFFEETYGSLANDPIERLPQDALEVREVIE